MKVLVTGGSGLAGSYIVSELLEHGYEVVVADIANPAGARRGATGPGEAAFIRTDSTDFGQVVAVMKGVDAVIHMAAIPNPLRAPEHEVFRVNMASDWNVLEAAEIHGIRKVVKASSINAVGAVFSKRRVAPLYFPIDEEHPTRAEDSYSQSKWLGEEMADGFCRRREMQIASMRFHALMEESRQADLRENGDTTTVDGRTAKEFWGWTDIGEAATACRLALENDWTGHEAFFINSTDTVLTVPTEEAIAAAYPGVKIRSPLPGFASAISVEKAKDVFKWDPRRTWRAS